MPQGNLNNLLGAARDFRNFQQEPEQIRIAKQDQKTQRSQNAQSFQMSQRSGEMLIKMQESGIDNELRAMKKKGELEVLYKYQNLPPEQRPAFLQREMVRLQASGEDVSKLFEVMKLPPDVQEDLINATISAAEQMGEGGQQPPMEAPKAPEQRNLTRNGESVVQEFNRSTGQWEDVEGAEPYVRPPTTSVNVINKAGTPDPTPFEKKFDEAFAQTAQQWVTVGRPQAEANLKGFENVIRKLKSGELNTRNIFEFLPIASEWARDVFTPSTSATVDRIRGIAFQVLRETLGAQFTEKEGQRLVATYFNPRLSEKENADRLETLANVTREIVENKNDMVDYMQKNRTIFGYKGSLGAGVGKFKSLVDSSLEEEIGKRAEELEAEGYEGEALLDKLQKEFEGEI